jgi:protein ImuA
MSVAAKQEIIDQLQKQILTLQGNGVQNDELPKLGLGEIETAFPSKIFPRAAVHELISYSSEDACCTNGFISVVLGKLMQQTGTCLWIGTQRKIFPAALKSFGVDPERVLFVDAKKNKDALWTIEEALKCNALTAVVGEVSELSFDESRRLQLAVERSKVTGLIHRHHPKSLNAVACVSRWKISSAPGIVSDEIPGVGFPHWNVELLKVRNGNPGNWKVQWSPRGLDYTIENNSAQQYYELKIA